MHHHIEKKAPNEIIILCASAYLDIVHLSMECGLRVYLFGSNSIFKSIILIIFFDSKSKYLFPYRCGVCFTMSACNLYAKCVPVGRTLQTNIKISYTRTAYKYSLCSDTLICLAITIRLCVCVFVSVNGKNNKS